MVLCCRQATTGASPCAAGAATARCGACSRPSAAAASTGAAASPATLASRAPRRTSATDLILCVTVIRSTLLSD